mmetsp:Transcript_20823/g.67439  ORF Transcript_20823/g.67439 Transcript_20823/m.67439 type:complete len:413 (-) Transcript_20823:29-1267(-)
MPVMSADTAVGTNKMFAMGLPASAPAASPPASTGQVSRAAASKSRAIIFRSNGAPGYKLASTTRISDRIKVSHAAISEAFRSTSAGLGLLPSRFNCLRVCSDPERMRAKTARRRCPSFIRNDWAEHRRLSATARVKSRRSSLFGNSVVLALTQMSSSRSTRTLMSACAIARSKIDTGITPAYSESTSEFVVIVVLVVVVVAAATAATSPGDGFLPLSSRWSFLAIRSTATIAPTDPPRPTTSESKGMRAPSRPPAFARTTCTAYSASDLRYLGSALSRAGRRAGIHHLRSFASSSSSRRRPSNSAEKSVLAAQLTASSFIAASVRWSRSGLSATISDAPIRGTSAASGWYRPLRCGPCARRRFAVPSTNAASFPAAACNSATRSKRTCVCFTTGACGSSQLAQHIVTRRSES